MEIRKEKKDNAYSIKITVEEDGKLAGWAYLYIIKNDRHDEPYGIMENVYVEQEYRGQGLGRKLVQTLIDEAKARGCYKLIGQSRYGKEAVHNLYKKFGFSDHGKNFRITFIDSTIKQRD